MEEVVLLTTELATKLQELLEHYNAEKLSAVESVPDQTYAPNNFVQELVICGDYFGEMPAPSTPDTDTEEEDLMPIASPPRSLYEAKIVSYSENTLDFYETVIDILLMECSDMALTTGQLYLAKSIGRYNVAAAENPEDYKFLFMTQAGGGGGGTDTVSLDVLVCAAPD